MEKFSARNNYLDLPHGRINYPVYLPDATYGMVRSVDAEDLEKASVQGVVMNTFHLMTKPGKLVVSSLGGLHKMSGWPHPIITDSGGFQIYSLIHDNESLGKINPDGFIYYPENSNRKINFTPEKSVQLQMSFGTDVVICLDECTHVDASYEDQKNSVEHTVNWAKRCKKEFDEQLKIRKIDTLPPKIFAVVQGGGYQDLRKQCADELLNIGFDGFGFGGWPLDNDGNLLEDVLSYVREVIPSEFPIHALGIGHPEFVTLCWHLGYDIFDCAMPTRDARHGRLYAFQNENPELTGKWLDYIYIDDEKHIREDEPISPLCDCPVCKRYSIGYLRHLFKMNDTLFQRLASIHNIRILTLLTEMLRKQRYGL